LVEGSGRAWSTCRRRKGDTDSGGRGKPGRNGSCDLKRAQSNCRSCNRDTGHSGRANLMVGPGRTTGELQGQKQAMSLGRLRQCAYILCANWRYRQTAGFGPRSTSSSRNCGEGKN